MPGPQSSPKSRWTGAFGHHLKRGRRFGGQVAWSFNAKLISALLQLAVLVLLARGLHPAGFAFASSVNVALTAFVALNGLGLMRQIQYRRSLDPNDPLLAHLYAARLRFTYASAVVWLFGCVILAITTGDSRFVAIIPTAIWLAVEQTTTVWNAISIVDHRNQALLPSYLYRRVPVVIALVLALELDLDTLWAWTIGLAVGSVLAFMRGWRLQEPWAQVNWPRRKNQVKIDLDLGFWWTEVGHQIRDLDVTALTLLNPHAGGIYAFPARLIRPMNLVTQATGSVAFPLLTRRKTITLRQLAVGLLLATVPVALVAVAVAACAPLIPKIVGPEYSGSVRPMQILCLAALTTGAITILNVFLQARSSEATRFAGYASVSAGVLQIALAALGGVWAGGSGAAVGATVAQLALFGLLLGRSVVQCRLEREQQAPRSGPEDEDPEKSVDRVDPITG